MQYMLAYVEVENQIKSDPISYLPDIVIHFKGLQTLLIQ